MFSWFKTKVINRCFFRFGPIVFSLLNRKEASGLETQVASANIKKILVLRTSFIGDVVTFLPTLSSLRNAFPGASITLVTSKEGVEIVSLDNLVDPCDVPDMSLGCHDTDWTECDIAVLPYLRHGRKEGKLIEILREERKEDRRWTYEQIKYSREKMINNKLIEKVCVIDPYPIDQCVYFDLFLKPEDSALTQKILCNFARNARIYKEYVRCNEWGLVICVSHPLFLSKLMYELDQQEEICEKELYQARSIPFGKYHFRKPIRLDSFDFENQTLEYPYHVYKEKIKEKIENELD